MRKLNAPEPTGHTDVPMSDCTVLRVPQNIWAWMRKTMADGGVHTFELRIVLHDVDDLAGTALREWTCTTPAIDANGNCIEATASTPREAYRIAQLLVQAVERERRAQRAS